jgi:excisionase family DNA binding protein
MFDDLLTPRQVAAELGVTTRTVQRWIADGRLRGERVGSRVRVSRASLARVATQPQTSRRIRTLLIANRGEIALRIARTARGSGVRAIGVRTPAERDPDGCDEVRVIGSYLDGEELIAVAQRSRADAVHPGYGFLAESPAFASAVQRAGLAWVGPPPEAIAQMGDKATARRLVAAHGVPVLFGYDGDDQSDATLTTEAASIGYPLLVKPSAGGGGKGMRVVAHSHELPDALAAARREAERAFGDDRLILERYLAGARHVEVQVLFDAHGAGIHLGERDCSAQRRSQKVIEEAPAPSVTPQLRVRLGEAALAAAAAVGYVNAGTVEFLVADDGSFAFIEMNTRLQVEHPVTEAVTGRDLVADQLRIAGGEPLGLTQDEVRIVGHAIEARLYAEDPEGGYLPATGMIARVRWPEHARIDTAVREGDEVSDRFDPLLAKLIVHAPTRPDAVARLREALDATTLLGVTTNLRHLRWLARTDALRDGELRTDTLATLGVPPPAAVSDTHWLAAAHLTGDRPTDAWGGGWRLNGPPAFRLATGDEQRLVRLTASAPPDVDAVRDGETLHVDIEGRSVAFRIAPAPTVDEAIRHAAGNAAGASVLLAPMPGRVVSVRAEAGTAVEPGMVLVVIEAMKMEHAVAAATTGRLTAIHVTEGQQVERGELLGEIAAYHADDG